jgi:transposase-like protein
MVARCRAEDGEICAFFIADHHVLRKYGLGYVKPAPVPFRQHVKSGYLLEGATLAELAGKIGADPVTLRRTVETYNIHAIRGEDPEFGKGSTSYKPLARGSGAQAQPLRRPDRQRTLLCRQAGRRRSRHLRGPALQRERPGARPSGTADRRALLRGQ